MVNLDPGRDYYADLEITPQATANDIKKQFKKLALKYHPDRNQGHEPEYIPRFQAISAANEILNDPTLRAKYDAQRMKEGLLKTHSDAPPRPHVPPRPRPAASTTTNFPPPPRPPPTFANKPSYSPPPHSGARRYERFNRAKPGWAHSDSEDAKTKTNDLKAWEQMRHGSGPIPTRRAPPPKPSRTAAFEPKRNSPPGRPPYESIPKPRGAWEDLRDAGMPHLARVNSTTRVPPRRAGFVPSSPPVEDPPRSAYFNVFNGDRPKSSTEMPPPPHRAPTSKKPDPPWSHVREPPDLNSARVSTPYSFNLGEKTSHRSPGLQRSTTSAMPRENADHKNQYKDKVHMNGDHVRASSTGSFDRNDYQRPPEFSSSTTSDASSGEEDEAGADDPHSVPHTYIPQEPNIPRSRKHRMPAGGGTTHRTGFSPHVRVGTGKIPDEGQAPHPLYDGSRRHSGIDMPSQQPVNDQPEGFMAHRLKHDPNHSAPQSSGNPAATGSTEHFMPRHRSFDDKYRSPNSRKGSGSLSQEDNDKTPIFRWPATHDKPFTPTPPLRSHSSDSIDVRFSPSATPPRFRGGSKIFEHRPSQQGKSSTFPVQAHDASENDSQIHREAINPNSALPPPPKVGDKWSSKDWEQRIGVHTFEVAPSGSNSRANSRKRSGTPKLGSSSNMKRPSTFRPGAFQPTVVDVIDEPPTSDVNLPEDISSGASSSRVSTGSEGSAMDIDSTPPSGNDSKLGVGVNASTSSKPMDRPLTPRGPALPPRASTPRQGDGDYSSNLDLDGFRHVAPFAPSKEGLEGVNDLKDALPFGSRPSSTKPNFENCLKPLDLPKVPRTPSPPNPISQTTWERYITDMNTYMFNWNSFNIDILLVFQRRQEEHRKIGPSWVGQVGGDCDAYLQALKEDERARKYWEVACDHHRECMENLKIVREKALKAHMGG